jgi:eukaryotic-like serine/threonine-protein kinase
VARLLGETARLTGTGTQVGTPYYMCPEAWEGQKLDEQADIWSLGVVLYELLTGRVPFSGETLVTVMNRVLTAPLPDVRAVRPEVPPELVRSSSGCWRGIRRSAIRRCGRWRWIWRRWRQS